MNNERLFRPVGGRGLWKPTGSQETLGGAFLGVFIPLAALEPNIVPDEKAMIEFASKLNRDDGLLMCAVLNGVVSGAGITSNEERQREAHQTVTTPRDGEAIVKWVQTHSTPSRVTTFFRGQLLELMRWVARYGDQTPGNQSSITEQVKRETFLRAAMVASELWSKRVYGGKLTGGETKDEALTRALGAFRKGVEEGGTALHMGVAFGRGAFLFEQYFPVRLPAFPELFRKATGLSVEEYFVCAGATMGHALDKPVDGRLFLDRAASATPYAAQFATFLAGEVQTPTDMEHRLWDQFEKVAFKSIIERPILRVSSGHHVVLDPGFYSDHMTVAPLFKILGGSVPTNQVFGAFGLAFEDYATDILRRLFQADVPFLAQRLYPSVESGAGVKPEFEIDAVVNEVTDLIVMEMKAVFVPESVFQSEDPDAFLDELGKKYAVSKNPKDRDKGVAQLARCIRAIVADDWNGADIDRDQLQQIFPVLVVHDDRMGSPGIGTFLNKIFREQLGELPAGIRVAPLTVMTIDDLENQESSHSFTLRDVLFEYTRDCPDGMISLHNYMSTSRFGREIRPSEALIEKSMTLARTMMAELFPGSQPG